jgi:copper(I)-binding protein
MRRRVRQACVLTTLTIAFSLVYGAESARVTDAWIEEGPPGVPVLAGYVLIQNPTAQTARVVKVASPRAERIEIHRTDITENTATMTRVSVLPIPPGGEIRFSPNGYHLMIFGVQEPPGPGEKVPLSFEFDGGSTVAVDAIVRRAEAPEGNIDHSNPEHNGH